MSLRNNLIFFQKGFRGSVLWKPLDKMENFVFMAPPGRRDLSASSVDLVAVCFLFVQYWSSLVGSRGDECWETCVTEYFWRLCHGRGPSRTTEVPLVLAEVPVVALRHRLAYQTINGAFARRVRMMVGFRGGVFFCFFFLVRLWEWSPNRQSQWRGVCESIHHNIVCPRASFSHTQITEIALTVAYTVTQTCLCTIYTNMTPPPKQNTALPLHPSWPLQCPHMPLLSSS